MDLGRDPMTKKRNQKWVTVKSTKAKAQSELRELLTKLDKGIPANNSKMTVGGCPTDWLRDAVVNRIWSRTVEGYITIVNRHIIPAIGSFHLQKLSPADVQRMESQLLASGLSPNTAHHVHVAFSKALKDAGRNGLAHRKVCQAVDSSNPGRYEAKVPDAEAIKEILALAQDAPYGPVLHFAAYPACRREEAIAPRWENIDLERSVAFIVETAQRLPGKDIVFQPT